jgi:hypothetical protein
MKPADRCRAAALAGSGAQPGQPLDLPPDKRPGFAAAISHGGQFWMPFPLEYQVLRMKNCPGSVMIRAASRWVKCPANPAAAWAVSCFPLRFRSLPEVVSLEIHFPQNRLLADTGGFL